jgi:uncharacterized protein YbjT (DUF2867 family)
MNLVVGATGMLGSEICRLLAASDKPRRSPDAKAIPSKVSTIAAS